MQSNITFPSKRLMLSLFVCSVLPILLMGRSFLQSDNIFQVLCQSDSEYFSRCCALFLFIR